MTINDIGPEPQSFDLETATIENTDYRAVAWSGKSGRDRARADAGPGTVLLRCQTTPLMAMKPIRWLAGMSGPVEP